ncbi:MAG: hypothetical protein EON54_14160, partial [Alcaligenaceae bacterium]
MNTTTNQRPSTAPASNTGAAQPIPHPVSGRENSGLMFFFIGAALLALLLVLFFNFLGPEGAARTGVGDGPARAPAGQTTGGPSPSSSASQPAAGTQGSSGAATGGAAPAAVNALQAPDSQTPPGREGVG